MLQFTFLLLALVYGQESEDQEHVAKKLGACWLKTIKDINNERESVGKIISSIENANKTQIYHKIQMSMISQCEAKIDINQENYLTLSYKEVVQDFDYNQFVSMDPLLTEEEQSLLKIIKKLEKDLGEMDKQNKLKKSYAETQQIENDWQQVWKENKPESSLLSKPSYFHYAFFLVLIGAIFGGGYWSLKFIQNMNVNNVRKQKKDKQ